MKKMNVKYLLVSLIITISLLLLAGCALTITETPPVDTEIPQATLPVSTPIDPGWTPPPATPCEALPSIADVVEKVKPSVVAINTEVVTYDIFNRPLRREGAGSGWIISGNGLIVTNNHVIEGAETITVTLADGRTFPADTGQVVTDSLTDLAVLRINATGLRAAPVNETRPLRVGERVVAIGNSLGLGISATAGIISATNVSLPVSSRQTLFDLIQTDAAINPGNSGGPLVNMSGEVIGITSVKIAAAGIEGMGYAISTATAIPII